LESTLCGSKKYPCPHPRGSLGISRGSWFLKATIFKEKYEPKLEFPEGWGVQTKKKNPPWEEYGYFLWNNTLKKKKRKKN